MTLSGTHCSEIYAMAAHPGNSPLPPSGAWRGRRATYAGHSQGIHSAHIQQVLARHIPRCQATAQTHAGRPSPSHDVRGSQL